MRVKDRLGPNSIGVWELLESTVPNPPSQTDVHNLPLSISDNFYFVASRARLNTKGQSYDMIHHDIPYLQDQILKPLIEWAREKGITYMLVDCQAGYAISSAAAAEIADMAIVVTEADAISSDAADNLLIQLGSILPGERRYLVNKVDVRDADTYRQMRNVFQTLNRLPPLPFDFAVRNAFGARQIPLDLSKPSPFLFALFETIKYMFTELFETIQSYKTTHVDSLFEEYDKKLDELLMEKRTVEDELAGIKSRDVRMRYRAAQVGIMSASVLLVMVSLMYSFRRFAPEIIFVGFLESTFCIAPDCLDTELSVFMQRLRMQGVAGEPGLG